LILLKNPGSSKSATHKPLNVNNSLFGWIAEAGVFQQNQKLQHFRFDPPSRYRRGPSA
jgi:hypothetical protein